MITGLNHLTLAVGNLDRAIAFYRDLLGLPLRARWLAGAYLEAGSLWLCLSLDAKRNPASSADYTHFALTITPEHFQPFTQKLLEHGVEPWQANRSEGDSFYFLDPDGHRLEIHVGNLASRLAACREKPYQNMEIYNDACR